jgi:hypothetical protein
MAHRPGLISTGSSAASPRTSARTPTAFRQEDLVHAMMTQLREKDVELAKYTKHCQVLMEQQKVADQTNLLLQSKIITYSEEASQKEAKIALLEEESLKHRLETIAESNERKRAIQERDLTIQERDDELSQLRPTVEALKMKIHEYDEREFKRQPSKLEVELKKVNDDLSISMNKILTFHDTIEQLEKKVRSKEWIIKTLKEENDEQRSRETQLFAQINKMNESMDTYESKFMGKGVDVPMLVAKLKDFEARTKQLEGEVSRLTNKKLNELVLRAGMGPGPSPLQQLNGRPKNPISPRKSILSPKSPQSCLSSKHGDNDVLLENTFTVANSTLFSNGTDTFYSSGTDETDDVVSLVDDGGLFDDFFSDVENGMDTLKMERICCSQKSSRAAMGSSPTSEHHNISSTPKFSFQ